MKQLFRKNQVISQVLRGLTEIEIEVPFYTGRTKLKPLVKQRMVEVYEQTLWQNVGIVSEHMLLWWLDEGLGKKNPLFSQKFNAWLKQYRNDGRNFPRYQRV